MSYPDCGDVQTNGTAETGTEEFAGALGGLRNLGELSTGGGRRQSSSKVAVLLWPRNQIKGLKQAKISAEITQHLDVSSKEADRGRVGEPRTPACFRNPRSTNPAALSQLPVLGQQQEIIKQIIFGFTQCPVPPCSVKNPEYLQISFQSFPLKSTSLRDLKGIFRSEETASLPKNNPIYQPGSGMWKNEPHFIL